MPVLDWLLDWLLELLGEGAVGEVYLVEQRDEMVRQLALKRIKKGMDSDLILSRFESERKALTLMNHHNITTIFDSGVDDCGRAYFVMEYVAGDHITEFCDDRKLTITERIKLFLQVCDGVLHAHQKGLIHRDIKSKNILVDSQAGQADVVKVIDFGVIKSLTTKLTDGTLHTQIGTFVGSIDYASPEQIMGKSNSIDIRSDIYSLGVVLYELLVGLRPFNDYTAGDISTFQYMDEVKKRSMPDPSILLNQRGTKDLIDITGKRSTDFKTLRKKLSGEIIWITQKCLEQKPNERYQTVNELKKDLSRWLNNFPVEAKNTGFIYKLKKGIIRNKNQVSVLLSLLILTIIVFFLTDRLYQNNKENNEHIKIVIESQIEQFNSINPTIIGINLYKKLSASMDEYLSSSNLTKEQKRFFKFHAKKHLDNFDFASNSIEEIEQLYFKPIIEKLDKNYKGLPLYQADIYAAISQIYFNFSKYKSSLKYVDKPWLSKVNI